MVRFISLSLNEKGPFLWSAYRITEKQKAGKAQNIKGKQLKNSRKPDKLLAEGDTVSARGFGKFQLSQVGGVTKKGRTAIVVKRYV